MPIQVEEQIRRELDHICGHCELGKSKALTDLVELCQILIPVYEKVLIAQHGRVDRPGPDGKELCGCEFDKEGERFDVGCGFVEEVLEVLRGDEEFVGLDNGFFCGVVVHGYVGCGGKVGGLGCCGGC